MSVALSLVIAATAGANGPTDAVLRRRAMTSDGVPLAVYRYVPAGGVTARPPVLLVPDLGMNRTAFDLEGQGLAPFLQEKGRDVFVLEPRGHGASGVPLGWRLADVVTRDLPAAMAAIRVLRPEPVDLVVHGYSGALVLAATRKELAGRVGRVVALSPAVMPEVPNSPVAELLRSGGQLGALGGTPGGARRFELLFARGGRFPAGRVEALRTVGFANLGQAAAADLLGWMERGDLRLPDGTTVRGRLAQYDRPTLLFLPLADNYAHPEFASPLRGMGPATVTVRVLSKRELLKEDYSHLSLLHGLGAPTDVFAPAQAFLEEPAAPASRAVVPAAGRVAADGGFGLDAGAP